MAMKKPSETVIQTAAAAKAQKTVANSQVPHNIVTRPSVSVARKTPSASGMGINSLQANNPIYAATAGTAASQGTPDNAAAALAQLAVPTQSYDGSTAVRAAGAPGAMPVDATSTDYSALPGFQDYMNIALNSYNTDKANTMFSNQQNIAALENAQNIQNENMPDNRRDLAGNFAKRGMMGGQAGAYMLAQDKQNAQLVASQLGTKEKIALLNNSFLNKFGPEGGDWTASQAGRGYKDQAIRNALQAKQSQILGAQ